MAKQASGTTRVYMDHYAWASFLTGAGLKVEQQTPESTSLSDAGPRRLVDGYDHTHTNTGIFDGADDSFDEQAFALLASADDHYLLQLFAGTTVGSLAYESIARMSGTPLEAKVGSAVVRSVDMSGSGGMSRGLVMINQSVTEAVDGASQDQGATSAGTEYQMVVRVISGSFSSITVTIQGSSDNAVGDPWADITGLEVTRTTAGATRDSVVIATERYKRAVVSAFTGTSALVIVTAGVVQGT